MDNVTISKVELPGYYTDMYRGKWTFVVHCHDVVKMLGLISMAVMESHGLISFKYSKAAGNLVLGCDSLINAQMLHTLYFNRLSEET